MYSADWCGYCARARRLLDAKGIAYEEIDVDVVEGAQAQMKARSGCSSIPQIFINDQYIGGSDEDKGNAIAVDSSGNAYVTGYTRSTEATFPVTVGPDLTYNGANDAFVAKASLAPL